MESTKTCLHKSLLTDIERAIEEGEEENEEETSEKVV